jgi:hypothetical protein
LEHNDGDKERVGMREDRGEGESPKNQPTQQPKGLSHKEISKRKKLPWSTNQWIKGSKERSLLYWGITHNVVHPYMDEFTIS